MRYIVNLVIESELSPQDLLSECVYVGARRPSTRIEILQGSVFVARDRVAHFEQGGEVTCVALENLKSRLTPRP